MNLEVCVMKYVLKDVLFAHDKEGKFVAPFIFNKEKNKVKDLLTGKVVFITREVLSENEQKLAEMKAVCSLYGKDELKIVDSYFALMFFANNINKIRGHVFADLKKQVRLNKALKTSVAEQDLIKNYVNTKTVEVADLKPLMEQVKPYVKKYFERKEEAKEISEETTNF